MDYLIICRSLTYAQRTESVLRAGGYRASLTRVPASVWKEGCGYGVKLRGADIGRAAELLNRRGLPPRKVVEAP